WMLVFGIIAVIVTIMTGIFSLQDLASLWKG
ncbi:divalent metal cation transporter, partial [Staphylococcus epidermidis]